MTQGRDTELGRRTGVEQGCVVDDGAGGMKLLVWCVCGAVWCGLVRAGLVRSGQVRHGLEESNGGLGGGRSDDNDENLKLSVWNDDGGGSSEAIVTRSV